MGSNCCAAKRPQSDSPPYLPKKQHSPEEVQQFTDDDADHSRSDLDFPLDPQLPTPVPSNRNDPKESDQPLRATESEQTVLFGTESLEQTNVQEVDQQLETQASAKEIVSIVSDLQTTREREQLSSNLVADSESFGTFETPSTVDSKWKSAEEENCNYIPNSESVVSVTSSSTDSPANEQRNNPLTEISIANEKPKSMDGTTMSSIGMSTTGMSSIDFKAKGPSTNIFNDSESKSSSNWTLDSISWSGQESEDQTYPSTEKFIVSTDYSETGLTDMATTQSGSPALRVVYRPGVEFDSNSEASELNTSSSEASLKRSDEFGSSSSSLSSDFTPVSVIGGGVSRHSPLKVPSSATESLDSKDSRTSKESTTSVALALKLPLNEVCDHMSPIQEIEEI